MMIILFNLNIYIFPLIPITVLPTEIFNVDSINIEFIIDNNYIRKLI
jgi:hypothetical protein